MDTPASPPYAIRATRAELINNANQILGQSQIQQVWLTDTLGRIDIKYTPNCKQPDKAWSLTLNTGLSHQMAFFASRTALIEAMPQQLQKWAP